MLNVGPFSLEVFLLFSAVVFAWLVARHWAKRQQQSARTASGWIVDAVLLGAITARVAYVLVWWPDYRGDWRAMLAIADGGFVSWLGVLVGFLWLFGRVYTQPALRWPVLGSAVMGVSAWLLASVMLLSLQQSLVLPSTTLSTLEGQEVQLEQYLDKPLVVNVWATWCPPCRREMPMLAHAQSLFSEVNIVLLNQGEDPYAVNKYLASQGLQMNNILIDLHSHSRYELGAHALPTTLFFDQQGKMQHAHVGELTLPALKDALQKVR